MVNRKYLYIVAGLIWGIPGIKITQQGIDAYARLLESDRLFLIIAGTLLVFFSFFFMFRRIVDRYSLHISSLPSKTWVWHVFPLRGWLMLLIMISLGIVLNHIPNIPIIFIALFYSGLGPMLLISAVRFIIYMLCKEMKFCH